MHRDVATRGGNSWHERRAVLPENTPFVPWTLQDDPAAATAVSRTGWRSSWGMVTQLLVAAGLSLAPATYSWWTGRRVLRSLDDPALPELMLARARHTTRVVCAAILASSFVP